MIGVNKSIAESTAMVSTKEYLISIHECLPISWSLEIVLLTIAVRTLVTFPLIISSRKILKRYEKLQPEINRFADQKYEEVKALQYMYNWSPVKAKLYHMRMVKNETKRLIVRDNCHPIKASIVVCFQIPIWIIFSQTIRNMSLMFPKVDQSSQLVYNQFSNEGILWFSNLTETDPYCVLPFLVAIINLTIIEIHSNERLSTGKKTRMHSLVTNLCRGITLILIPIGLQMPSAVCFYWFTSSAVGLIHNLILRNKRFAQKLGIDLKGLSTDSHKKSH